MKYICFVNPATHPIRIRPKAIQNYINITHMCEWVWVGGFVYRGSFSMQKSSLFYVCIIALFFLMLTCCVALYLLTATLEQDISISNV